MKYDHHLLVEDQPTTLQPQSTSFSVTSEAGDAIVLNEEEDKGIPDGQQCSRTFSIVLVICLDELQKQNVTVGEILST